MEELRNNAEWPFSVLQEWNIWITCREGKLNTWLFFHAQQKGSEKSYDLFMRPQVRECCLRVQNYPVLGENILLASFRGGWEACMTCSGRTCPGSSIIKPHPHCNHFIVSLDAVPAAIRTETAWSLKHVLSYSITWCQNPAMKTLKLTCWWCTLQHTYLHVL